MSENEDDIFNKDDVAGISRASDHRRDSGYRPWYKPRKQWVRDMQWWESLNFLLNKYNIFSEITCLKYFGLSGADLLDIEHLRQMLSTSEKYNDKSILFHGFVSSVNEKSSVDSKLTELLDRDNIDSNSIVDRFHFDSLKEDNSLSYEKIKKLGPYHLINLDFCNCVFQEKTLLSMYKLVDFQVKRQIDIPWLFCVTSRTDKESVSSTVFSRLDDVFEKLKDSENPIPAVQECFSAVCTDIDLNLKLGSPDIAGSTFSILLQICFVLWVVTIVIERKAKIELVSSMRYSVNGSNDFPDMSSFVFRIYLKDHIAPDKSGLVTTSTFIQDHTKLKIDALKKLAGSLDIDEHFKQNPEVDRLYTQKSKELLQSCGLDVSNYDELINSNDTVSEYYGD